MMCKDIYNYIRKRYKKLHYFIEQNCYSTKQINHSETLWNASEMYKSCCAYLKIIKSDKLDQKLIHTPINGLKAVEWGLHKPQNSKSTDIQVLTSVVEDNHHHIYEGIDLPKNVLLEKLNLDKNTFDNLCAGQVCLPISLYNRVIKQLTKIKHECNNKRKADIERK